MQYVLEQTGGSRCPKCRTLVHLFCEKEWRKKEAYYLCFHCGFVAEVGKGPVGQAYRVEVRRKLRAVKKGVEPGVGKVIWATGYFGIPGRDGGKVHYCEMSTHGRLAPACGTRLDKRAVFQWCADGEKPGMIECKRYKNTL